MRAFLQLLATGLLLLGLCIVASDPSGLNAQDKKDAKKDAKKDPKEMKKDPPKAADGINAGKTDVSGSFVTSDGLALRRYWYSSGKASADTVVMFPAPGNKINDTWHQLAKAIQKEGFSVFLFDWRGCGESGIDRAERIFAKTTAFEKDAFNQLHAPKSALSRGLDYRTFSGRYKDYLLNDLQGARFALDKQNDAGQCNTNRIWFISEGAGAHLGLAFIAAERDRETLYPKQNLTDRTTSPPASLDYAGFVALSFTPTSNTASAVYSNALPTAGKGVRETIEHLDRRLAMVMVYGKKEGPSASKSLLNRYVNVSDEQEMKRRFKYLKEIDNTGGAKAPSGIDLITEKDTFGTQAYILEAMKQIRDRNDAGKEPTKRGAADLTECKAFEINKFKSR